MNERAVLNPSQFVPELQELDLDSLGLAVRVDGVDWGEASIEPQMVKSAQGESSAAGRRGGVTIRVPIRVREEGEMPLAEAAFLLESVVAGWQEEGGWILRDYDDDLGFAGSLGYRIIRHTANLSGLQGWLMAHTRVAPDVILTATRWPIGLSPEEYETAAVTMGAGERELILDLDEIGGGSVPGLIRYRLDNENETEHLRGLILAAEWRDHPQDETADTTAALSYDAADLTLRGGSTVVETEGITVVENDELTAGWLTILSSEVDGIGHMTHSGVRRPWLRAKDFGAEPGAVQYHLRWRPLGALSWSGAPPDNPILPSPLVGDWAEMDLGEVRPQPPMLGEPRIEWELQARAPSGTGKVQLHKVRMYPTEQFVVLRSPEVAQAADEQTEARLPAVAESTGSVLSVSWSSPSNVKAADGSVAKATFAYEAE